VTGLVFLALHLIGYACSALVAALTLSLWLEHRREESAEQQLERIAKLELKTGVGLDVGREWLLSQPIQAMPASLRQLAEEGNGAVTRKCWDCEKEFRAHDEHDNWGGFYPHRHKPDKELAGRLCATCYAGALTELERL
jgi:hypothetical protein